MNLQEYLNSTVGTGVLATADQHGRVDAAIYSRPQIAEDNSVVFIMRERLTYSNLQVNPYAAFLFLADGPGHRDIRLFLKKIREDDDRARGPKHLVVFRVERLLKLIGGQEADINLV